LFGVCNYRLTTPRAELSWRLQLPGRSSQSKRIAVYASPPAGVCQICNLDPRKWFAGVASIDPLRHQDDVAKRVRRTALELMIRTFYHSARSVSLRRSRRRVKVTTPTTAIAIASPSRAVVPERDETAATDRCATELAPVAWPSFTRTRGVEASGDDCAPCEKGGTASARSTRAVRSTSPGYRTEIRGVSSEIRGTSFTEI
jgi:hypothetical protein